MDELVKAALIKWPHVPACKGWLGLSARGDWYMRDDATQAAGPFPAARGSRIEHPALLAFIQRNYACDEAGCWYFQNGPQRVYVELEYTPWVWRVAEGPTWQLLAPEQAPQNAITCWMDEADMLYVQTSLGLGLVHSLDMGLAAEAIDAGAWPEPQTFASGDLPAAFGFVRSPASPAP